MKKKLPFAKIMLFLVTSVALVFQEILPQEKTSRIINFKSIHQIEWELHNNFVLKEKAPRFEGRPSDVVQKTDAPSQEIFGYLPYWVYANYPNLNYDLLTTIAYFGAEVTDQGNLINLRDWPAAGLVNEAHSEGVRVVLTAINFVPTSISSVIGDPNRRSNLINNLIAKVQAANADGVNIDFEGVPGDQRLNLTSFMTELSDAFHTAIPGSFVTIFTPAVDWSNAFDYFALAQITDGLVISGYDYHWRTAPTAGPVAPLTGTRWGFYNISWTVNDYLTKTAGNTSKLILGVPFYGFEWPTVSDGLEAATLDVGRAIFYSEAYPNALQYGRLWDAESQTPWYKYTDGQWHQGWYDDSLSLALKFQLVNDEDLKGIGIWALSYDGERQELQGALADAFGATASPLKPTAFQIVNLGDGRVQIAGDASSGATAYKIYRSQDGVNFNQGTDFPSTSNILTDLSPDTTYYFKMSALNGNGESNLTEVLAVRPTIEQVEVLIVNSFDRTTGTVNTFDFIKRFAPSVAKKGYAFDSCSNEAVENGDILLTNYKIVLWISGEEGTATLSFSPIEQTLVAAYLEKGGNLFVSGSEIGYHLEERGSSSDKAFYRVYLKADYIKDDTGVYSASGTANGIFKNLQAITFDNGTYGTYDVDFPDGIKPVDGAVMNMTYNGVNPNSHGGAGLHHEGIFGNANVSGKLVYIGFPFETIYPESSRDLVMSAVLDFFQAIPTIVEQSPSTTTTPEAFELAQNYPNPFNPSTTISFGLTNKIPKHTTLKIFNLLGQEIKTLIDESLSEGKYEIVWDGRDNRNEMMSSGVYIYRLQVGNQAQVKKMTLVK